jgi:hypothetical protein
MVQSDRLTDWLSSSGGTGETLLNYRVISGKSRLRGAAEPLSAGAGVSPLKVDSESTPSSSKILLNQSIATQATFL